MPLTGGNFRAPKFSSAWPRSGNSAAASSATTAAVAALTGIGRGAVVLALRLARMAQLAGLTGERFGFAQQNLRSRLDELEAFIVRRFLVELKGLVAHGVALAAFQTMAVVVEHFLERSFVDDGLVALEAIALLAFERFDRQRA